MHGLVGQGLVNRERLEVGSCLESVGLGPLQLQMELALALSVDVLFESFADHGQHYDLLQQWHCISD